MAGKKGAGENSKKAAGNAQKAEAAAAKAAQQNAKKAQEEDEDWGKGAKSNAKKYVHLTLMLEFPMKRRTSRSSSDKAQNDPASTPSTPLRHHIWLTGL